MEEQHDGGLHPHEGLAVESKDRQEEDGVGLKKKRMDLVVVRDGEEEPGERRHEPRKEAVEEKGKNAPAKAPCSAEPT